MTKLALHEKKYGKIDRSRNAYFKWDYIYINNWYTRFTVGIVALIVIGYFMFNDVYVKEIIPIIEIDAIEYLTKYIILFIAMLVTYTGISTIIYSKKYNITEARVKEYREILEELDAYENSKWRKEGEAYDADR